jgi:hypothetical protein
MEITGSRDEDGAGMVYVRCNDGSIWMDTGNRQVPWFRLLAIPEPTAEDVEAAERARRAAIEEGFRQHEALQEVVRANQERLREERAQAEAILREEREATQKTFAKRSRPFWWHW